MVIISDALPNKGSLAFLNILFINEKDDPKKINRAWDFSLSGLRQSRIS
jgi:hypothetical protein